MKRRPQLRWSMPAVAGGPVYGPVSAISAFEQDGFSADADAGEADPPTLAAIAAAAATSATPKASPILLFIPLLLLRSLPTVTAFAVHCFSSYATAGLPDGWKTPRIRIGAEPEFSMVCT